MSDMKIRIQDSILRFNQGNLSENALTLFQTLGYATDRQSPFTEKTFESFKKSYLNGQSVFREEKALVRDWKYIDLLFQLSGEEIEFGAAKQRALIKKELKTHGDSKTVIESYLFFAIELTKQQYTRTELSQITREVNNVFPMPVMIVFKHGKRISISVINRRLHKRDPERRDVLEKVTLIKDINIEVPHRAHIEILFDLSLERLRAEYKFSDFVELHTAWQKTLDTKELNKQFYSKLFNWYLWALKNVKFPQIRPTEDLIKDNTHQSESLIRLLTRLLFCWFMKEKGLINSELFNTENLNGMLKGFKGQGSDETIYYKAILQNLFFATLSKPIIDRKLIKNIFPNPAYGDPLVYRYAELFKKEADILKYFENIPFLNGGLFDCLDSRKDEHNPVEIRLDGFSSKKSKQPIVPDKLFFGEYPGINLSDEYDDNKKSKVTVYGLIDILTHYKFTIEENTPIEEEIALDPELLGKVFENLLASYNPETHATARKQTGSFYTPREIVNYMVDESLKAYLKQKLTENKAMKPEDADVALGFLFEYSEKEHLFDEKQVAVLIAAIDSCKVLDPACGSGAFPMGVLQKLIHVLRKIDHDNKQWFEIVIGKFPASAQNAMRAKLEHENWDYVRKLGIIQECIYGVDIQPIAIQISKLRFFITLLVDQNGKLGAVNRGFEALPNLDFKLVAANTLISVPDADIIATGLFVDNFFDEFDRLTGQYFNANTPETKKELKERITEIITAKCDEKVKNIKNISGHHDEGIRKILAEKYKNRIEEKQREVKLWNSYKNLFKQEAVGFFEPKYFFPKAASGFDIVLGNPPYVRADEQLDDNKCLREQILASGQYETLWEKWDLFVAFIEKGFKMLKSGGITTMIVSDAFCHSKYAQKSQSWFLNNSRVLRLDFCSDLKIFEAAVHNLIYFFQRAEGANNTPARRVHRETFGNVTMLPSDVQVNLTHRAFFPEDTVTHIFACKSVKLDAICYVTKGMVVNAHESLAQGAFTMDDLVQDTRDSKHPKRFVEGKHLGMWLPTTHRWLEWGTARAPALFSRQTFPEIYETDEKILVQRSPGPDPKCCYDATHLHFTESTVAFIPWCALAGVRNNSLKKAAHYHSEMPPRPDLPKREELEGTSRRFPVKYLLGVMNSTSARNFLRANRRSNIHLYPDDWKNLPIPDVSSEQQQPIIALVDQILRAKRANLDADIAVIEADLDTRVRSLYDLTPEQIRINVGRKGRCNQ